MRVEIVLRVENALKKHILRTTRLHTARGLNTTFIVPSAWSVKILCTLTFFVKKTFYSETRMNN